MLNLIRWHRIKEILFWIFIFIYIIIWIIFIFLIIYYNLIFFFYILLPFIKSIIKFIINKILIFFLNVYFFIFFYFFLFQFFIIIFSFFYISFLGYYGIFFIHFLSWLIFWINLLFIYFYIGYNNLFIYINCGIWFKFNFTNLCYIEFLFDSISFNYMLLTVTIAVSVILYTFSYFRYEPLVDRLIILISSFVISMLILVNSGNFLILFLGWELIGLTSFLLINFWNTRVATLKSAFKAFSFNKFSDLALLIGILLIYNEFYTFNINIFRLQLNFFLLHFFTLWTFKFNILEIISFFFLIASFIKSAQIGFHLWLPDSMEAPVPASALIHSATLVSAGVFLLLRLNQLFELSLFSYLLIQIVGSTTAFYGGFCAIFQSDIKKLLAYSTISHCGFLMVCVSLESIELTILYLYIHGFFKATSFLCVGNIIRVSLNYQDFRRMGMYFKYLPFEFYTLTICLLNLSGAPFTIGFYSKHLLFVNLQNLTIFFWFIFINCFFAALFGFIYCFRLLYNIFFCFKKGKKNIYKHMNNKNYKSIFYSNTSILSIISITFLLINCYFFCGYLLILFFKINNLQYIFSEFLFSNINLYSINFKNLLLLKNFKIFNLFSFFLIFFLFIFYYKYNFFFFKLLNNFIFFIFFIFFYFFLIKTSYVMSTYFGYNLYK